VTGTIDYSNLCQLWNTAERLVIANDILAHENRNLREVIIEEKKRRKRGKPMGLINKDNPRQAHFFSPKTIKVAFARMDAIEEAKALELATVIEKKLRQ
jgi:hypothetical protein